MTLVARWTAIALCAVAAVGCGGSETEDASPDEARSVLQNLDSLGKGEIVIKATSSNTFGPYTFEPGGYLFRFRRDGSGGRLTVTVESEQNARGEPIQALVDTTEASGRRSMKASGELYVRVVNTGSSYELRFTPRQ